MLFVHHATKQAHHATEKAQPYTCPLQSAASSPEPGPQPRVKTHKAPEEQRRRGQLQQRYNSSDDEPRHIGVVREIAVSPVGNTAQAMCSLVLLRDWHTERRK